MMNKLFDLTGKTALITGSGRGLGFTFAKGYVEAGARVVLNDVSREELDKAGVSVVITRRPCALIPTGKGKKEDRTTVNYDSCTACGACIRMMCPALTEGSDKKPVIDWDTCNSCGLCRNLCRFGALTKGGRES